MYRIKDIQQALKHLVGWEQSYDPLNAISEELTESESGLTFQGAHPLCTLDNVRAIMPDNFELQYPFWSAEIAYEKGNKVRHGQNVWVALANNVGAEPSEGATWEVFNPMSDYLETLTLNGISQTIQNFITQKQLDKETKTLLERRTLFDGSGRLAEKINPTHKLVGFEIVPVRSMGVSTKIERVGLQMYGGTGKITLYLFHSSQREPLKTFEVEFTKTNGGFQWFDLKDCYLPYRGDNNSGGSWFFCYNQDDLPQGMQAINMTKDWSREPCGTCNVGNIEVWREITKYIQVAPFLTQAPKTFKQYPEMWDVADIMHTNTINYGLNCEISVGCDLTDFIISQRDMFANAVQKQVAVNVLRTLAMNPNVRVNRNQSNASRMDILYEIDGNTQGREGGLGADLKKAYQALKLDTQGIDRVCMTCNNYGVRYRTA